LLRLRSAGEVRALRCLLLLVLCRCVLDVLNVLVVLGALLSGDLPALLCSNLLDLLVLLLEEPLVILHVG